MNNILDGLDYQRFLNYLPEDKRHWFLIYLFYVIQNFIPMMTI